MRVALRHRDRAVAEEVANLLEPPLPAPRPLYEMRGASVAKVMKANAASDPGLRAPSRDGDEHPPSLLVDLDDAQLARALVLSESLELRERVPLVAIIPAAVVALRIRLASGPGEEQV